VTRSRAMSGASSMLIVGLALFFSAFPESLPTDGFWFSYFKITIYVNIEYKKIPEPLFRSRDLFNDCYEESVHVTFLKT
jgi:hypothetical protein